MAPSTITERSRGDDMYGWIRDLMPLNRSITGDGVRQTLTYLKERLPGLCIQEIPTGTPAFDWEVPNEWNPRSAYLEDEAGNRFADFSVHNLHLVGYSEPMDAWLTLEELQPHLYSLENQPHAIPYVTSYYQRGWGFCLSHAERQKMKPGRYHVHIDAMLEPGHLTYGELIIPGESQQEVLLSTYICHPSMANNELSGPTVVTALGQWLSQVDRRYTYRLVFVPETIGSIVYLSRNLQTMKANTIAGFQVTCVGDDRAYSYLESRLGNTYADKVLRHVLHHHAGTFDSYAFSTRGSDERQYCSPGVDLPVATFCRSKFGTYPEYHTSLDDLSVVSPEGLQGAFDVLLQCIEAIEVNAKFLATIPCEPRFGKHGLYPNVDTVGSGIDIRPLRDLYAYSDGNFDVLDIAERTGRPIRDYFSVLNSLLECGLLIPAPAH
jgi:aminopeptidase-like protein